MIEDYNAKILHILEDNSQQIFQKHGINDKIFDDSIREYLEDDEVSSAIHSLATVEEKYIHYSFHRILVHKLQVI
jgi:hypothetical protein